MRGGLLTIFSYLDRINVSNARLAGLQEDLHMSDTVWNTGISTFYVGYLVGQLPGNLWLAKSNPGKVLPTMALAWSVATICMPAVTRYAACHHVWAQNSSQLNLFIVALDLLYAGSRRGLLKLLSSQALP